MSEILVPQTKVRSFGWFAMAAIALVLALSAALGVALGTRHSSGGSPRTVYVQAPGDTCTGSRVGPC